MNDTTPWICGGFLSYDNGNRLPTNPSHTCYTINNDKHFGQFSDSDDIQIRYVLF